MTNENNIFLIGFMGAGKSTIARAFSELHGMEIVEMDQLISEKNGLSVSDIFARYGEEYFRNEETELLRSLQGKTNRIVSCGGGVAMRPVNVEEMRKSGPVVLLQAKPETILERVRDDHGRPLLENRKTVASIAELLEARNPAYLRAADIQIDTDGKSAEQIAAEILQAVESL